MIPSKPMLMTADMIKATLNHTKTMTRRIIKPQPQHARGYRIVYQDSLAWEKSKRVNMEGDTPAVLDYMKSHCPYGQVGDLIWIRERIRCLSIGEGDDYQMACGPHTGQTALVEYVADDERRYCGYLNPKEVEQAERVKRKGSVPSIHMPRWASRIMLMIKDIRVERVQDISEYDAKSEGVEFLCDKHDQCGVWRDYSIAPEDNEGYNHFQTPKESFKSLWDSINAKRFDGTACWANSPYVWVIEFSVLAPHMKGPSE